MPPVNGWLLGAPRPGRWCCVVDGSPAAGDGSRRTVRIPCSGAGIRAGRCRLVVAGSGACRRLVACAALRRQVGYPAAEAAKLGQWSDGVEFAVLLYEGSCCLRAVRIRDVRV